MAPAFWARLLFAHLFSPSCLGSITALVYFGDEVLQALQFASPVSRHSLGQIGEAPINSGISNCLLIIFAAVKVIHVAQTIRTFHISPFLLLVS